MLKFEQWAECSVLREVLPKSEYRPEEWARMTWHNIHGHGDDETQYKNYVRYVVSRTLLGRFLEGVAEK